MTVHLGFGVRNLSVRFTSSRDVLLLVKAVALRSLVVVLLFYGVGANLPRSILIASAFLLFLGLCGTRFAFRLASNAVVKRNLAVDLEPTLIVGTGAPGETLCRQLFDFPQLGFKPVGFITLDGEDVGTRIQNCPVVGRLDGLSAAAAAHRVKSVIVARSADTAKFSLTVA